MVGMSEADQVTKAEMKMTMLVAKNNIYFAFCDGFSKSVANMFPDPAIRENQFNEKKEERAAYRNENGAHSV